MENKKTISRQEEIFSASQDQTHEMLFPYVRTSREKTVSSPFYRALLEALPKFYRQEGFGGELDENKAIIRLARKLGLDPWNIQGFLPLPKDQTVADVAREIAMAVGDFSLEKPAIDFLKSVKGVDFVGGLEMGVYKSFGNIISVLIDNFDLTDKAFAKEFRMFQKGLICSKSVVYNWVNDNKVPYDEVIVNLIDFFGLEKEEGDMISRKAIEQREINYSKSLASERLPFARISNRFKLPKQKKKEFSKEKNNEILPKEIREADNFGDYVKGFMKLRGVDIRKFADLLYPQRHAQVDVKRVRNWLNSDGLPGMDARRTARDINKMAKFLDIKGQAKDRLFELAIELYAEIRTPSATERLVNEIDAKGYAPEVVNKFKEKEMPFSTAEQQRASGGMGLRV